MQQPDSVGHEYLTDRDGRRVLGGDGLPIRARVYNYTRPGMDPERVKIQEHSDGHKFGEPDGAGDQGPHFNARPQGGERNDKVPDVKDHYPFGR